VLRPRTVRLIAVLAGVIAAVSLTTASASAAGKPQVSCCGGWGWATFNSLELIGSVNPNGAETTYVFEYGPTAGLGGTTSSGNVGSGTSWVSAEKKVLGLNPHQKYYYRVKATNKYGTVTSSIASRSTAFFEPWYYEGKESKATFPEIYESTGSLTISVPTLGGLEITCKEWGTGEIGNVGGIGDEYNMNFYDCSIPKEPKCDVEVSSMHLNPNYTSKNANIVNVEMGELCSAFSMELVAKEPFSMKLPPWAGYTKFPMNLTMKSSFGAHTVTITNTSDWGLGGIGAGEEFSWEIA
jgi:hypothetical protein